MNKRFLRYLVCALVPVILLAACSQNPVEWKYAPSGNSQVQSMGDGSAVAAQSGASNALSSAGGASSSHVSGTWTASGFGGSTGGEPSSNARVNSASPPVFSKFQPTLRLSDFYIRDPDIVVSPSEKVYYMFGTTGNPFSADKMGFVYYKSYDLKLWAGPYDAFNPSSFQMEGSYTDTWAAEVHQYKGNYYMFASFGVNHVRHCAILNSKTGEIGGPYEFWQNSATPSGWNSIDGTLYVQNGTPWLVFSHEWIDFPDKDGRMYAQQLTADLKGNVGSPVMLFKGSSAGTGSQAFYVTDGPYLFHTASGRLCMLWSTLNGDNYLLLYAFSPTGSVTGPWNQVKAPLFGSNGGHGMVFQDLSGTTRVVFHYPNSGAVEHAVIYTLQDNGSTLSLK